jgi:hypothetical protein
LGKKVADEVLLKRPSGNLSVVIVSISATKPCQ